MSSPFARSLNAAAPFALPANHYCLTSQSYGAETYDSVGRATYIGASTKGFPFNAAVLNGPPSAAYVPRGVGKTRALMGATRPPSGMASWGQMRTAHQTMKYTPVFPMLP